MLILGQYVYVSLLISFASSEDFSPLKHLLYDRFRLVALEVRVSNKATSKKSRLFDKVTAMIHKLDKEEKE